MISFTVNWKIDRDEYLKLSANDHRITKNFITSYKNVPLFWKAEISSNHTAKKFSLFVQYEDGPIEKIEDCQSEIKTFAPGFRLVQIYKSKYDCSRGNNTVCGVQDFGDYDEEDDE